MTPAKSSDSSRENFQQNTQILRTQHSNDCVNLPNNSQNQEETLQALRQLVVNMTENRQNVMNAQKTVTGTASETAPLKTIPLNISVSNTDQVTESLKNTSNSIGKLSVPQKVVTGYSEQDILSMPTVIICNSGQSSQVQNVIEIPTCK